MYKNLINWYKKYTKIFDEEVMHFLNEIESNTKKYVCSHKNWNRREHPGVIVFKCDNCGQEHKFKTDVRCLKRCK